LSNLDLEHHHSFEFKPVGQFRGASLLQEQSADKKFVKYFLLTAKDINGNGWGVSQDSIASNIKDFIGQPLVATSRQFIADSEYGDTYTHPYIPTNHIPTIFAHQNKFAIGIIRDVVEEHGNWNAIAEIFPKYAHMKPPPFCSPGIFQLDPREPEGNISKWKALHLAVLDAEPAYGAQMAIMKGSCVGTLNECKVQFKGAKFESSNTEQKKEMQREELETIDTEEEDKKNTASVICPIKLGNKLRRVALQGKFQKLAYKSDKEIEDSRIPYPRKSYNEIEKTRPEGTYQNYEQSSKEGDYVLHNNKIRPSKPTQKDRQRIISAKLQLIAGLNQRMAYTEIGKPHTKPEYGKDDVDETGQLPILNRVGDEVQAHGHKIGHELLENSKLSDYAIPKVKDTFNMMLRNIEEENDNSFGPKFEGTIKGHPDQKQYDSLETVKSRVLNSAHYEHDKDFGMGDSGEERRPQNKGEELGRKLFEPFQKMRDEEIAQNPHRIQDHLEGRKLINQFGDSLFNKMQESIQKNLQPKIRPPKPTNADRRKMIGARLMKIASQGEENMTYQDSKKVKIIKKKNEEDE